MDLIHNIFHLRKAYTIECNFSFKNTLLNAVCHGGLRNNYEGTCKGFHVETETGKISQAMTTYSSLIHLFLSSGREFSRSDWRVIKSEWRADICWTMPGADTYVDNAAWASEDHKAARI